MIQDRRFVFLETEPNDYSVRWVRLTAENFFLIFYGAREERVGNSNTQTLYKILQQ